MAIRIRACTSPGSNTLGLVTGGTDRIRIDSSGFVGVGTVTPLAKLDVNGDASVSGNLTFAGGARTIQATAMNSLTIGGSSTGNIFLNPRNGASGGLVAPVTDNVTSLGASSSARFKDLFLGPSSLHIQCTTGDGCGQGLDYGLSVNTAGTFNIGVNGTTAAPNARLSIMQGGNVGVGTTTPGAPLDVSGNVHIRGTTKEYFSGRETRTYRNVAQYNIDAATQTGTVKN